MQILIADDCKTRYGKLIDCLGELGVPRSNITLVGSADEAQRALEISKYDLLVLDILLPFFPTEEDVSHENSLNILNRLNYDD